MQKPGKLVKSELLQENTGLKSENEELKNKLAQMEALIKSLQLSKEAVSLPIPTADNLPGEDTVPTEETKEEEVVTVTFQAHHMLSDESDMSVGLVIDGVSVKRKKKRSKKKRANKKKTHKLRRKRKQKPRDKKGKNARKKEEGRSISFTATTSLPDEVLGSSEFPAEKKVEELKKQVYTKLREKTVSLQKVSTEETVEKLLQEELAKGKRSAFYLVNLGTLCEKFVEWQRLLPRIQPHYAMKCNPDSVLVQTLQLLGIGFDCASKKELETAFAAGAQPHQIIFANPCKQVEHIEYAKSMNVKLMTFDSKEELVKVLSRFPEAELVLRILPDDSNSLMPFGTKFGAGKEEVTELLAECKLRKANLVGVSFHVGSGCYAVDAFTDAIRLARSVFDEAENIGFNLKLLDIGGGFPGISTATSTLYDSSDSESEDSSRGYESGSGGNEISPQISFEEIAMAIGPLIDELFPSDVRVISEPGRYFVTAAATLAVNVVCRRERVRGYLKENRVMGMAPQQSNNADDSAVIEQIEADEMSAGSGDESSMDEQLTKEVLYYLSDGIYGSFNNIIFDHATPFPALLSPANERVGAPIKRERSCLFGPTCDSIDVICKNVALPRLNVGDWLYFVNMGAYTTASASNFNGIAMPEYHYIISMRDPSDVADSSPFPPAPSVIDIIK